MFIRSPRSYLDIKDSNMLKLPSGLQLRKYNNFVIQEAGIKREI